MVPGKFNAAELATQPVTTAAQLTAVGYVDSQNQYDTDYLLRTCE